MNEAVGKRQRVTDSLSTWESDEPPSKRTRGLETGGRRKDHQRDDIGAKSRSTDASKTIRERSRSRLGLNRENMDHKLARDRGRSDDHTKARRERSRSKNGHRSNLDPPQHRHRARSPKGDMSRRQASADDGFLASSQTTSTVSKKDSTRIRATSMSQANKASHQDSETASIERVMGFSGFVSTKNTKVPGNNVGAVRKDKQIRARQYMNRMGGFNRPLSPTR